MAELAEGDDPRDVLEMVYQRRLAALATARAELAAASAARRRLEGDLQAIPDSVDAARILARVKVSITRERNLEHLAEAARVSADECRVERDLVQAIQDAEFGRRCARQALGQLKDYGGAE